MASTNPEEKNIETKNGQFAIGRFLGAGGFGRVYEAMDLKNRKTVCCKKIPYVRITGGDPDWDLKVKENNRAKFEVQCLLLGQNHPNIVQYLDYVQLGECLWVFMELCVHGDLHEFVKPFRFGLPSEKMVFFMSDAAAAVAFLHQSKPPKFRIVHRYIKLQNFLVHFHLMGHVVKLGDFGLSRLFSSEKSQVAFITSVAETLLFMAPEFFDEQSKVQYDSSVDIFALGLVFAVLLIYKGDEADLKPKSCNARSSGIISQYGLEVLASLKTGTPFPEIFPPSESSEDPVTSQLKDLVMGMLQPRPTDRLTAMQVLERLHELQIAKFRKDLDGSLVGKLAGKQLDWLNNQVKDFVRVTEEQNPKVQKNRTTKSGVDMKKLNESLVSAAWFGNLDEVQRCIDQGADVNARGILGSRPVHLAAACGHAHVVRYLMSRGCDVTMRDDEGSTPLHWAAQGGDKDIVKFLVEEMNAEIDAADNRGDRPVHWAAQHGHAHIVRYLVSRGCDVTVKTDAGRTLLHCAAWGGDGDTVKFLVEEMNAVIDIADNKGLRPVHEAAGCGHAHVVRYLVSRGCDVTVRTDDGRTPLHCAAVRDNIDTVKFLVEDMNADKDAADIQGLRPVHWASVSGHAHVLSYLVSRGCDVTVRDYAGRTPLHWAAQGGRIDIAKLLVEEMNADKDAADNEGRRPVHLAAEQGHTRVESYLGPRGYLLGTYFIPIIFVYILLMCSIYIQVYMEQKFL